MQHLSCGLLVVEGAVSHDFFKNCLLGRELLGLCSQINDCEMSAHRANPHLQVC